MGRPITRAAEPAAALAALANAPPLIAGWAAARRLADAPNVVTFWRAVAGIPAALIHWLAVAGVTVALGRPGWLAAFAALTAAGLTCLLQALEGVVREAGVKLRIILRL